jgi:multidrug resistance efflux pump
MSEDKETLKPEQNGRSDLPAITLRSELAQEIISRRAGFVENWSLPIFLLILISIFGSAWFIRYPDAINARATLLAENAPMRMVVQKEATIFKLFLKDGQEIKRGDVVGWMESSADHQNVLTLLAQTTKAIDLLDQNKFSEALNVINANLNNLGEIQQAYQQFLLAERYIKSNATKIILQEQLLLLKSKLVDWVKHYVIIAPVEGQLSFNGNIHEGRYLPLGSLIGYVIPKKSNYYAEALLPQASFGRLDIGQKVQLKLDAYPYEEWGALNGKVNYISSVLTQGGFLITIKLDPDFISNNNKKILVKNGLGAQAMIITKDVRLLQKLYSGFIKNTSMDNSR